jgi:hypothetical protein
MTSSTLPGIVDQHPYLLRTDPVKQSTSGFLLVLTVVALCGSEP